MNKFAGPMIVGYNTLCFRQLSWRYCAALVGKKKLPMVRVDLHPTAPAFVHETVAVLQDLEWQLTSSGTAVFR